MRLYAAAFLLAFFPGQALASGSIGCSSSDGQASVELTVGSLPVLRIVQATIAAGGQEWHIEGTGGQAVAIGQAFRDDETMRVDFTDPDIGDVVARLRLYHATEGKSAAMAGILQIAGEGVWALDCVGP